MIDLKGKLLVLAPESLVGSKVCQLLGFENLYGAGQRTGMDVSKFIDYFDLDITSPESVLEVIKKFPGKYVLNFAGATDVDGIEKTKPQDPNNQAELDQNLAYKINVIGTQNIIAACKTLDKFPIFISTGFVFDGEKGGYGDDDAVADDPNKVGWYAWTKILAEREVESSGIDFLNLRISYPYRDEYEVKLDFARNFLKLYDDSVKGEREIYPIFTDQELNFTLVDDLAEVIKLLIEKGEKGNFNISSPDFTTPYEFDCELLRVARKVENPEKIIPKGSIVSFQESHPNMAKRPLHGGMKSEKISSLGFIPTGWKEGLRKVYF